MKKHLALVLGSLALLSACSSDKPEQETITVTAGENQETMPAEQVVGKVYFAFDKAVLTAESKKELEKQALWLCQHEDKQIILKGYTDPRGTQAYNLKLGERRAQAVKDFLISEGVAANRITVVSYGKKDPASSMNDPAGWAKDRRAVTVAITD